MEILTPPKADQLTISLVERIEATDVDILDWTDTEFSNFVKSLHLISANVIQSYLHPIRKIHEYNLLQKKGKVVNHLNLIEPTINYIDLKRLRSKTIISWDELFEIRKHLLVESKRLPSHRSTPTYYNYRDVVLLELPWYGLTASEIQHLKNEDIEVLDINKLCLHLPKRNVIIDNPVVVDDIFHCQTSTVYVKIKYYEDREVEDILNFQFSPYLIKGIANGNSVVNRYVNQPSNLLAKQLEKLHMPEGFPVNVSTLSLEDIRRSLIIYLLNSETNISIINLQFILNKRQQNDLAWLKHVAKKLLEV